MVAATAPSGTIARPARLFKLSGLLAMVVETARLYNCGRCHCQVVICRHCDHGNVYCRSCAPVAGRESHCRADAEYQKSDRGKKNHKARQQRYLEKMTVSVRWSAPLWLRSRTG
jgi:late competence protein required for DNA uptake (superfamily II DNA/RNA helicase)